VRAATELWEIVDTFTRCFKNKSELRFVSLVTDLMALANLTAATLKEKTKCKKNCQLFRYQQEQFSLLDQFIDKTAETKPARAGRVVLGFSTVHWKQRKKFKNAGID
jgi:hypothetical protein